MHQSELRTNDFFYRIFRRFGDRLGRPTLVQKANFVWQIFVSKKCGARALIQARLEIENNYMGKLSTMQWSPPSNYMYMCTL